jgi:hypothetical protein
VVHPTDCIRVSVCLNALMSWVSRQDQSRSRWALQIGTNPVAKARVKNLDGGHKTRLDNLTLVNRQVRHFFNSGLIQMDETTPSGYRGNEPQLGRIHYHTDFFAQLANSCLVRIFSPRKATPRQSKSGLIRMTHRQNHITRPDRNRDAMVLARKPPPSAEDRIGHAVCQPVDPIDLLPHGH